MSTPDNVSSPDPGPVAGGTPARPATGAAPGPDRYPRGLYAVFAGLAALVVLDLAAIIVFRHDATNAVAAVGTISAPIAALVSAYFGIKVGSQNGAEAAANADQARTVAENQVKATLAHLDPAVAIPLARSLGFLPSPDTGGQGR